MASVFERLNATFWPSTKGLSWPPSWAGDALSWPLLSTTPLYDGTRRRSKPTTPAYIQQAYKAGIGIIFAAIAARQAVYSQARFSWQQYRQRPARRDCSSLSWICCIIRGRTARSGEWLSRIEVTAAWREHYAALADDQGRLGRAAVGSASRRIVHMRPDWTTIIIDSASGNPNALDARVVGYLYRTASARRRVPDRRPGGAAAAGGVPLLPETRPGRPVPGDGWITPIVEEIRADKAATTHKRRMFTNGATPNLAVTFDKDTNPEAFDLFVETFRRNHQGPITPARPCSWPAAPTSAPELRLSEAWTSPTPKGRERSASRWPRGARRDLQMAKGPRGVDPEHGELLGLETVVRRR